MKWTSTQNLAWVEECRGFATKREQFRLDHVCGGKELGFCESFCVEHAYRRLSQGSSVLFTPNPD